MSVSRFMVAAGGVVILGTGTTWLARWRQYITAKSPSSSASPETMNSSNMKSHTCPICFDTFNSESCRGYNTPCGHTFCQACIERIENCPVCRSPLEGLAKCSRAHALEALVEEIRDYTKAQSDRQVPEDSSDDDSSSDDEGGLSLKACSKRVLMIQESELEVDESAPISTGRFAHIYRGRWGGTTVVIKKLFLHAGTGWRPKQNMRDNGAGAEPGEGGGSGMGEWGGVRSREIGVLSRLRHPHVVQLMGCVRFSSGGLGIVMEYCERGSIADTLYLGHLRLTPSQLTRYAQHACRALYYLHGLGFVHRDVTAANLLVAGGGEVKLADFGLSRKQALTRTMSGSTGTYPYTAPEVLRGDFYDESVDMYSFGILLWELVEQTPPHNDIPEPALILAVASHGLRPDVPQNCPAPLLALMLGCWDEVPLNRPTAQQAMKLVDRMVQIEGEREGGAGRERHRVMEGAGVDSMEFDERVGRGTGVHGGSGRGGGRGRGCVEEKKSKEEEKEVGEYEVMRQLLQEQLEQQHQRRLQGCVHAGEQQWQQKQEEGGAGEEVEEISSGSSSFSRTSGSDTGSAPPVATAAAAAVSSSLSLLTQTHEYFYAIRPIRAVASTPSARAGSEDQRVVGVQEQHQPLYHSQSQDQQQQRQQHHHLPHPHSSPSEHIEEWDSATSTSTGSSLGSLTTIPMSSEHSSAPSPQLLPSCHYPSHHPSATSPADRTPPSPSCSSPIFSSPLSSSPPTPTGTDNRGSPYSSSPSSPRSPRMGDMGEVAGMGGSAASLGSSFTSFSSATSTSLDCASAGGAATPHPPHPTQPHPYPQPSEQRLYPGAWGAVAVGALCRADPASVCHPSPNAPSICTAPFCPSPAAAARLHRGDGWGAGVGCSNYPQQEEEQQQQHEQQQEEKQEQPLPPSPCALDTSFLMVSSTVSLAPSLALVSPSLAPSLASGGAMSPISPRPSSPLPFPFLPGSPAVSDQCDRELRRRRGCEGEERCDMRCEGEGSGGGEGEDEGGRDNGRCCRRAVTGSGSRRREGGNTCCFGNREDVGGDAAGTGAGAEGSGNVEEGRPGEGEGAGGGLSLMMSTLSTIRIGGGERAPDTTTAADVEDSIIVSAVGPGRAPALFPPAPAHSDSTVADSIVLVASSTPSPPPVATAPVPASGTTAAFAGAPQGQAEAIE